MGYMYEFPHSKMFDSDLRQIIEMYFTLKNLPNQWEEFKKLSDDKMIKAVDDWLREHPEVTTTVQDKSLTEEKFSDELKLNTIKDYATPQMFGAKADGQADDTLAVKSALLSNKSVYFPNGTYLISETLDIGNNNILVGGKGAKILVNCELLFNITSYFNNKAIIENMIIDANGHKVIKADSGTWGTSYALKNVVIENMVEESILNIDTYNVNMENSTFFTKEVDANNIVNLGGNGTAFANLVNIENCVFNGDPNAGAAREATLLKIGNAKNVYINTTTFEFFNTAIDGMAFTTNCWFESGKLCTTNINTLFIRPTFSNVEQKQIVNGIDGSMRFAENFLPFLDTGEQYLLASCLKSEKQLLTLPVEGQANGQYDYIDLVKVNTNKAIFNMPVNEDFIIIESNEYGFSHNKYLLPTKGTFMIEINHIKTDGETSHKVYYKAILKDNAMTIIDNSDSGDGSTITKSTFRYDGANLYFTITDYNPGTIYANIKINRVSV